MRHCNVLYPEKSSCHDEKEFSKLPLKNSKVRQHIDREMLLRALKENGRKPFYEVTDKAKTTSSGIRIMLLIAIMPRLRH
jgi:hypothetical protein